MDPTEYLKGIKRRWRLVAAIVALGLMGAWVLTSIVGIGGSKSSVTASTTLMQSTARSTGTSRSTTSAAQSGTSSIQTIAALVTVDQVGQKVAAELEFTGDPKQLSRRIKAEIEPKTGFLRITATSGDPERAKLLADSFARQLLSFLVERDTQANAAFAQSLEEQIARIRAEVKALDNQIRKYPAAAAALSGANQRNSGSENVSANTGTPADPLIVQRNAALQQIQNLSAQLQEVKSRSPDADGLQIVQTAVLGGSSGSGLGIPSSLWARLLIALVVSSLGGVALVLVLDRLDRRIRTREAAERHFGFPVLAEIPVVRTRRRFLAIGKRAPAARRLTELPPAVADAYRLLGAGLNGATSSNGIPGHDRRKRPRAILVTSAGVEDGKTAVLANLASAFASVGKTVTVVGCDFRHPLVHEELGVSNERGVTDVILSSNGGPMLGSALWQTPVSGVWAVPAGNTTLQPDALLSSPAMRRLLMEARQLSDIVLIDTSPIMTSDAAFLLPEVDAVLVVVKAGTTKPELAERSSELLKRLKAPVLGVILMGTSEAALPRGYYRSRSMPQLAFAFPLSAVRVVRRGIATVLRLGRRKDGKGATPPVAPAEVSRTIVLDPPTAAPPNAAEKASHGNGGGGFPRLMRRSGRR